MPGRTSHHTLVQHEAVTFVAEDEQGECGSLGSTQFHLEKSGKAGLRLPPNCLEG